MSNEKLLEIAHEFGYNGEGLQALYQWADENNVRVTEEMFKAYGKGYYHWWKEK